MSLAATLLLAATAAHAVPAAKTDEPDRGAVVETAHIGATILRSVALNRGQLVSSEHAHVPHYQRQARDGRITYEFE